MGFVGIFGFWICGFTFLGIVGVGWGVLTRGDGMTVVTGVTLILIGGEGGGIKLVTAILDPKIDPTTIDPHTIIANRTPLEDLELLLTDVLVDETEESDCINSSFTIIF